MRNQRGNNLLPRTMWQLTLMAFIIACAPSSSSALYLHPPIFPGEDQEYGNRHYLSKSIFPEHDQGYGYRNYLAKRIISVDDQGFGFRDYRAKRIFPTEDQGRGYRDYRAKRVFPTEDQGQGYRNYRSKRLSPELSSSCNLCVLTYYPEHCIRCWYSRSPIVPIYAKRGSPALSDSEYERGESDLAGGLGALESLSDVRSADPRRSEEKAGNFSADDYALDGRQPLDRRQRGNWCSCCYISRLSNQQCCQMCQLSTKRSGNLLTSDEEGDESELPSKRAYLANPDCFCCLRNGGDACCSLCFSK